MSINKLFLLNIIIITITFCFLGCSSSENEQYNSVVCDIANDSTGVSVESDYWSKGYFNKEIGRASCRERV